MADAAWTRSLRRPLLGVATWSVAAIVSGAKGSSGLRASCAADDELCQFRSWSANGCCNPAASCTYYRYAGLNLSFVPETWDAYCRLEGALVRGSMLLALERSASSFDPRGLQNGVFGQQAIVAAISEVARATSGERNDTAVQLSLQRDLAPRPMRGRRNRTVVVSFVIYALATRAPELSAALSSSGAEAMGEALNQKLESAGLADECGAARVLSMAIDNEHVVGLPREFSDKDSAPLGGSQGSQDSVTTVRNAVLAVSAVGVILAGALGLICRPRNHKRVPTFLSLDNSTEER